MDVLLITILLFCLMELANVIILYFKPNSKLGNSMSVFKNYKEAKKDKTLNLFVHYLVYWVQE